MKSDNMTLNQSSKPKQDLPKLLYPIKETAYILSVSEKSVRRFLERGLLKTSHALRTKLITRESIENFVKMTT
jgi:hypothetical protein